jgi:hypothetical protein
VALYPMSPIFHVLPSFPTLKLSSLYLVIFGYPHLIHMKFDSGYFSAMNSACHFLHFNRLDFVLEENVLAFKL